MENLRLTFLIFGIVAIVAVLVHGLWTIRKNGKSNSKAKFQSKNWDAKSEPSLDDDSNEKFDMHGIGSVRVVSSSFNDTSGLNELENNQDVEESSEHHIDSTVENTFKINELDAEESNDERHELPVGSTNYVNEINSSDNESLSAEVDLEEPRNDLESKGVENINDDLSLSKTKMDFSALGKEYEKEAPSKLYGSVVTHPKPEYQKPKRQHDQSHRQVSSQDVSDIPEPPPFLLKSEAVKPETTPTAQKPNEIESDRELAAPGRIEPEFKLDAEQTPREQAKPISIGEHARKLVSRRKKSVAESIRKEPQFQADKKLNEEQMRIDFTNEESIAAASKAYSESLSLASEQRPESKGPAAIKEPSANAGPSTNQVPKVSKEASLNQPAVGKSEPQEQATDVLVLNIRAPADREITGAALLPMLLTLGLKFGEQDIFHRHVNTNGKGPVLFSLANLFKPGIFDIDNIENFSTRGLSLFMMLPIEGDPQQVFNMMHNAARKLADEFGCQILDGSRGVLTKQGLQRYSERIRDFERKRINR